MMGFNHRHHFKDEYGIRFSFSKRINHSKVPDITFPVRCSVQSRLVYILKSRRFAMFSVCDNIIDAITLRLSAETRSRNPVCENRVIRFVQLVRLSNGRNTTIAVIGKYREKQANIFLEILFDSNVMLRGCTASFYQTD